MDHRRLMRDAFTRHGGVEVDTQGDAFFVAFSDAHKAVAAAADAQRALEPGAIKVRMAPHTGEPIVTPEGYVGLDVHRAARISSTAHGGQIVLSERTRSLLDETLLVDLGLHRLKHLSRLERLYQLGHEEFPALRSLNATNVPTQPSEPIGRKEEIADLVSLVAHAPLVTLTGPGGTGKTRLALQVAAEVLETFPDGFFWVPLAPIGDPELVLPAVAQTLGATQDLRKHVDERRILLLLDDLEQVLSVGPLLSELLDACPNLHLPVTGRALLRFDRERPYPHRGRSPRTRRSGCSNGAPPMPNRSTRSSRSAVESIAFPSPSSSPRHERDSFPRCPPEARSRERTGGARVVTCEW
jgi:hypothetical protein